MNPYVLLMLGILLISWLVSARLKSKFAEYSQIAFHANLSGAEVATKMLKDNGIYDVQVVSIDGELTDNYNPNEKTVNLSPEVYNGRSVASAAVAAHECGHAVQHARAYAWLGLRSKLVPSVSFASKYVQFIILGGFILAFFSPVLGIGVVAAGVILFALTTLFAFVTLPVEIDASRRALVWLNSSGIVNSQEHDMAQDALKWAALTYVVAALGSLATLLYYISLFTGRRR